MSPDARIRAAPVDSNWVDTVLVEDAVRARRQVEEAYRSMMRIQSEASALARTLQQSYEQVYGPEIMYRNMIRKQEALSPLKLESILAEFPPKNLQGLRRHLPDLVAKYGPYCQGCSIDLVQNPGLLEIDHIRPKADGGSSDLINLVLLCSSCNKRKGWRFTLSGLQSRLRDDTKIKKHVIREGRLGRENRLAKWAVPRFPGLVVHLRPLEPSVAYLAAYVVKRKVEKQILKYKELYEIMPRRIDYRIHLKYERLDPAITLSYSCVRVEDSIDGEIKDGLFPDEVMDAPALFVELVHRQIVDRYEEQQMANSDGMKAVI